MGSTIRVVDSSFNPVDEMRYTAYGVSRDPGTNLMTDHLFTGQIEDKSIALYWYASRAYNPDIGRFTCPDTVVPEPGNPRALSRYSYVLNNPLKYTDSTGHWLDQVWEAVGDSFKNRHGEIWKPTGDETSPERYFQQDRGTGLWNMMDRSGNVVASFTHLPAPDPQATPAAGESWEQCRVSDVPQPDFVMRPLAEKDVPASWHPLYDPSMEKAQARGLHNLINLWEAAREPLVFVASVGLNAKSSLELGGGVESLGGALLGEGLQGAVQSFGGDWVSGREQLGHASVERAALQVHTAATQVGVAAAVCAPSGPGGWATAASFVIGLSADMMRR